jgi:hypothetical protein
MSTRIYLLLEDSRESHSDYAGYEDGSGFDGLVYHSTSLKRVEQKAFEYVVKHNKLERDDADWNESLVKDGEVVPCREFKSKAEFERWRNGRDWEWVARRLNQWRFDIPMIVHIDLEI